MSAVFLREIGMLRPLQGDVFARPFGVPSAEPRLRGSGGNVKKAVRARCLAGGDGGAAGGVVVCRTSEGRARRRRRYHSDDGAAGSFCSLDPPDARRFRR